MKSAEIFYLHLHGEQRGPYTIRHIDHLLNSGLITDDTLFWREGLEQWQPVTQLVARRTPQNRWRKPIIACLIALPVLLLLQVFGSITLEGWREANQSEFSPKAAYWRARDVVRHQAVPAGAVVDFAELEEAAVELRPNEGAKVLLRGELINGVSNVTQATWEVQMRYDPQAKEWSGVSARKVPET